jgi:hypothetical protein
MEFEDHKTHEPIDSESFEVRVPLPDGTTHVGLVNAGHELASLSLSNSTPTVQVDQSAQAWTGVQTLSWSASDIDGDPLNVAVMYSPDNGTTWYPIDVDDTGDSFTFDTSVLEGDQVLVRVLASDGLRTTIAQSAPITVEHGTPRTWGDVDCSGDVGPIDSLKILKTDAGVTVSQTVPGCPDFKSGVTAGGASEEWADDNCDGTVDPVDSLITLRFDAGLTITPALGCPAMGVSVSVQT